MLKIYKNIYYYLRGMDKQFLIKLTPDEQKIFNMLKKYRDELQLKTVLRVAGGWVRDKVLGNQSKDIDIALDNMKGEEFVTILKNHADKGSEKISGFGVTKFNPDRSKNLQTATAKIDGHWIDFVNLRSQKYSEDSRIPTIQIGTPLQDAQRRDFTINSLFYNIDTQQIQDWTEKGFKDLQNRTLRTPLDPLLTFKDDPLRILRCLRFKSRFEFKVDEKIYQAMKNPDIQQALLRKVSKERIGIELAGLLKAKSFLLGLEDIKNYGLWNIVFEIPQDCELGQKKEIQHEIPERSFEYARLFVKSLQQNGWLTEKQLIAEQEEEVQEKEKPKNKKKQKITYPAKQLQFMMILSCLTYVYKKDQVKIGKTKSNLVTYMIKDQLKYSAKIAKFAQHFIQSVDKLAQIKSLNNTYEVIKWLRFAAQKWELAIHFLHVHWQVFNIKPPIDVFKLREDVFKNRFENSYLAQAPIDGNFLTKKGLKGPAISKTLQSAIIWRIMNPDKPNSEFIKQFEQNLHNDIQE